MKKLYIKNGSHYYSFLKKSDRDLFLTDNPNAVKISPKDFSLRKIIEIQ